MPSHSVIEVADLGQSLVAAREQIPITIGRAEVRNSQPTSGHVRTEPSRPTLLTPGQADRRSQASTGRDDDVIRQRHGTSLRGFPP